jgi:hypothetical protein
LAIACIPLLYGLGRQVLFELRLNELQHFCEGLRAGMSLSELEEKAGESGVLRVSLPSSSLDESEYRNIYLTGSAYRGWACSLRFRSGSLYEHVFGADHGSRESFLKR